MRTREGRHIVGDYQMVSGDVDVCRKFPDVIAKCIMPAHSGGPFHSASHPGYAMNINLFSDGKSHQPKDGGSYDIPYRSLVPKNVEGMLTVGKLVSVTEDFKRDLLPDNIITGQAGGVAAALCAKKGITPRELEKDGFTPLAPFYLVLEYLSAWSGPSSTLTSRNIFPLQKLPISFWLLLLSE